MTSFRANPALQQELERDPHYRAGLRVHAEEIKEMAGHLMKRGDHPHGHLADRFVVVEDHGEIRVTNTDFAAHLAEFGSANNPPYAPLRRAVLAVGLDLREAPKR